MKHVNELAYKIDMLGEYEVSAIFNVSNLSPFDIGEDSRINPSERGEDNIKLVPKNTLMKDFIHEKLTMPMIN